MNDAKESQQRISDVYKILQEKRDGLHVCFTKRVICSDYPPLQPFPLQEAREVYGLVVGGKWSSTQIITNYSVVRERGRKRDGNHLITR